MALDRVTIRSRFCQGTRPFDEALVRGGAALAFGVAGAGERGCDVVQAFDRLEDCVDRAVGALFVGEARFGSGG